MSNQDFVRRLRTSGGPSHDLLVLLDTHRVLTTNQLARATGAPVRTVRHRLDRLRTAGLIDAVRPGRESGSAPRHWWLRTTGARLVSGTAAAPGRQRPSGLHVAHAATIGEMWLAVATTARPPDSYCASGGQTGLAGRHGKPARPAGAPAPAG